MQIEQWSVGKSTIRYLIPRTKENGTVHNVWENAGMNRIAIMKASKRPNYYLAHISCNKHSRNSKRDKSQQYV